MNGKWILSFDVNFKGENSIQKPMEGGTRVEIEIPTRSEKEIEAVNKAQVFLEILKSNNDFLHKLCNAENDDEVTLGNTNLEFKKKSKI